MPRWSAPPAPSPPRREPAFFDGAGRGDGLLSSTPPYCEYALFDDSGTGTNARESLMGPAGSYISVEALRLRELFFEPLRPGRLSDDARRARESSAGRCSGLGLRSRPAVGLTRACSVSLRMLSVLPRLLDRAGARDRTGVRLAASAATVWRIRFRTRLRARVCSCSNCSTSSVSCRPRVE